MNIGGHVKGGGKLIPSLQAGVEIGATSIQIFTQSPRMWKPSLYSDEVLAAFRQAQAEHPTVHETFCHATYLINMATPNPELLEKSQAALTHNMSVARGMSAAGVVLHVGSHMGEGFEKQLPQIAKGLLKALDKSTKAPKGCPDVPLLLENTAGAGGTVGRSFEELGAIIDACGKDERLGLCIDTQHLWASGYDYSSLESTASLIADVKRYIGLERLKCFHLNDSKTDLGSNRDRHANIGEGTIGQKGLGVLMAHPAIRELPLILEVPGESDGPRSSDVEDAKKAMKAGLKLYEKAAAKPAKATTKKK
jgi:deoxyribonuclease-4